MLFRTKTAMVSEADALPGRTDQTMPVPDAHVVNGHPLRGPWPDGYRTAVFGLGCFWGAEKLFWEMPGVWSTAVGYAGGYTPNPTYEEVCSGRTGHTEVVLVVYDPSAVTYEQLLAAFWEDHDPSQGMRQGNDVGTQYRSAIYTTTNDEGDDDQLAAAEATKATFQRVLHDGGYGDITTEIRPLGELYYAEPYHQQYLAKNVNGYCPIHSTGCRLPA